MAKAKKSDLYVVTKVKELTKYVITVTEKSPKKFRFTLVVRLQNYCLDALEHIVTANMLQAESVMFLGKWIVSDKKRNQASSGEMPQKDA